MKKSKTISKIIPDHVVTNKNGKWAFEGLQLDIETIDTLASESEMFKNTLLYKMWSGHIRTEAIKSIIQDSKDFRDVENGKALLINLDKLENMMLDLIKQHKEIVKKQ